MHMQWVIGTAGVKAEGRQKEVERNNDKQSLLMI